MISLLLMVLSLAGATEPALAGVPLAALPALGVTEPTFIEGADSWRAVVAGGWALHQWSPDDARAEADFRFTLATIQASLPSTTVDGADEARGNERFVVARRGNVVVQVRGENARALAAALLAAEVSETAASKQRIALSGLDVPSPRDAFGRRAP